MHLIMLPINNKGGNPEDIPVTGIGTGTGSGSADPPGSVTGPGAETGSGTADTLGL